MNRNIEIKARLIDKDRAMAEATRLSDTPPEVIVQEDTFFHCDQGRLKLRAFPDGTGELIHYLRNDKAGPKESNYIVYETKAPDKLKETLARSYGVRGVVRKKRTLFLHGRTRIHIDEVEKLGRFIELEVVLEADEAPEEGDRIARELMERLNISESDLIESAYIDML